MRLLLAALVALPLLVAGAHAQSAERVFPFPTHVRDLDNGLRVIAVPTGLPDVVSLQLIVGTGSRDEVEPGRSGYAHFFEHMMFRGTETIPASTYQDILKRAGGDQNAYTTNDRTVYHTTFLKESLPEMMRIEADRFQNLAYSEDDFRTEARAVLGEYNKNFANPLQKLFEVQAAAAFQVHTYRHTTMGFLEDVEAMPEGFDYAQSFFERFYRPENVTLLVAGDVTPDEVFALAEQYFGDWAPGFQAPVIPTEPPLAGPVARHVDWDGPTPPWVTVGFRGPSAYPMGADSDGDMQALDVLASLAFGPSSDLYRRLVIEEQVADQLWASFGDSRDPGLLTIAARVKDPADVAAVRDAIQAEVARWRSLTPDADRLDALKRRFRYGFASQMDNTEGIADALVPTLAVARDPALLEAIYANYAALTPEDVRAAADTYFRDANMVVVTLSQEPLPAAALTTGSVDDHLSRVDPTSGPAASDAPEVTAEPVARWQDRTAVGAQFATVRLPGDSPLVSLRMLFATGAADDPAGQEGLAELTARMVADAGSRVLSYSQIQDALFPLASGLNAQVDKEMTVFATTVHQDNLDALWDIVGGQLLDPGFRTDDFERVKGDLLSDLRVGLRAGNDEELGKEILYEVLYRDQPYGHVTLGHADAIEALTLDDVRAFYRERYTQDRLTLGVGGAIPDPALAAVRRGLGSLPLTGAPTRAIPAPPMPTQRTALVVSKPETRAAAISMGFPISVTRRSDDFVALDLVRSWLGEHRNSSAHLFQRIREVRGMNYGDYAYIEYFPRGMFQFMPAPNLARQSQIFQIWIRPVPPEQAHFAIRLATYELDKLVRDGLSEADFEATRAFLRNYVALLTATEGRRLGYALDQRTYGQDDFVAWYRAGLEALTLDDVNRVIREHLAAPLQIVAVTPEADKLAEALRSDAPSPMRYASPVPGDVAVEDEVVQVYPLELAPDAVRVVPVEEVFEGDLPIR